MDICARRACLLALHACTCPASSLMRSKRHAFACTGYGQFLTSWGGTSLAKTLLKPVIVAVTYGLGNQSFIDNYMVQALINPMDCSHSHN